MLRIESSINAKSFIKIWKPFCIICGRNPVEIPYILFSLIERWYCLVIHINFVSLMTEHVGCLGDKLEIESHFSTSYFTCYRCFVVEQVNEINYFCCHDRRNECFCCSWFNSYIQGGKISFWTIRMDLNGCEWMGMPE